MLFSNCVTETFLLYLCLDCSCEMAGKKGFFSGLQKRFDPCQASEIAYLLQDFVQGN